jgi:hypothetical protein
MVMRITEDGGYAVPLPVIEENENDNGVLVDNAVEEEGEDEREEEPVTMQDAFMGILHNARNLILSENIPMENVHDTIATQPSQPNIVVEYNDLSWDDDGQNMSNVDHDSQSETSDLGIDVCTDDFTGGMNDGQLGRLGRFLGLRPCVQSASSSSRTAAVVTNVRELNHSTQHENGGDDEDDHDGDLPPRVVTMITSTNNGRTVLGGNHSMEGPQQEQQPEEISGEEVINQALSTMVDNYATSARDAVTNAITNATVSFVESTSHSLIRAGTWLSSLSGVGLLGLYTASHVVQRQPYRHGLGLATRMMTTNNGESSSRRFGQGRTERNYWMTGLLSTMTMGMVTAGGAYVVRFLTRRYMTNHRALTEKKDKVDNS